MTSVTFEKVEKTFGRGAPVLRSIDLTIASGEFVTLVGPSGCGKSTLLNLIAGFEQPTAGHVRIDGEVVDDLSPKERGVSMVFQSYALYPHMTVRQNIAFPLEVARTDKKTIAARVEETAERLGLSALLDRKPKELSGGQRQRVALGRALVRKPRLCLFDEPLSNLDAALRAQMRAEIKKLHEELKATFVYVTHDQTEAMTMSDRIVILNAGAIQQAAPPREVYARPKNTFVASFIGMPQINLLSPAALEVPAEMVGGRKLVAGIRPEDVEIGAGAAPDGAITGKVYVVEPMGPETWVTLEIGKERMTGRAPADFAARSGEQAWARYDVARLHLFNETNSERVERS